MCKVHNVGLRYIKCWKAAFYLFRQKTERLLCKIFGWQCSTDILQSLKSEMSHMWDKVIFSGDTAAEAQRDLLIAAWGNEVFQSLRSEMWQMQGKVTFSWKRGANCSARYSDGNVTLRSYKDWSQRYCKPGGLPFLAIERQIAHREILIAAWGNEVFQSLRSEMWQMRGKVTFSGKNSCS